MDANAAKYEGLVSGKGERLWNQSYYYQAYDPATRLGAFVRLGFLENVPEANTWLIVFRDGRPLFARTNQNLPYTTARPQDGIDIAGMRIHAEVPLAKTRITCEAPDFAIDWTWDELAPMEDCIAMTREAEGSLSHEIAQVHLEGTSRVTGHLVHRGERVEIDGRGFRDVAAGVRNWDGLSHYRLAWPVLDNGMAFAGVHGRSVDGRDAYMRMMYDGRHWRRVQKIEERLEFDEEGFAVTRAEWAWVDEDGKRWEVSGRPLFSWLYPLDTFVLREQLFEFRLSDGTIGHGLHETGYRLPWTPIRKDP